jgi:hypothetical protein
LLSLFHVDVQLLQRPIPKGVQDIGTWQTIFELLSYIAVCTNAGIICFTMVVLDGFTLTGRLWIFIGFQWTMITIQMVVAYLIPDVPDKVTVQLQRQAFYNSKAIDFTPDEFHEPAIDEDSVDSPQKGEGMAANLMNNLTHVNRSFMQPSMHISRGNQFDKKYSGVSDIPPGTHPTSAPAAVCLAGLLQGPAARERLLPVQPDIIISTAQLEARYGPAKTSTTPSPKPLDSNDVSMSFGVSTTASSHKLVAPSESPSYTQVNKAGDSDDEASFPTAV